MIHNLARPIAAGLICSVVFLILALCGIAVNGQENGQEKETPEPQSKAVLKGKVELDANAKQSWNGDELTIELPQIKARLRQFVTLPPPPFPTGYAQWTPQQKQTWQAEFSQTEAGKAIIARNKQALANAFSTDIRIEPDGSFVVFDVPPGEYGIQGRTDKEINGNKYAFEIFAQLEVKSKVDEVALAPLRVEVTPLLERGSEAPPFRVDTYDGKSTLERSAFKGRVLFLHFWTSRSPTAVQEQRMVQQMYSQLREKYNLSLLSINVDEDKSKSLNFLLKNQVREGSHGFTEGLAHPTLKHYGVRGVPSFWLIGDDNKILMNQFEFARTMRLESDLNRIVVDRLTGNDEPTPANSGPK